MFPYNPYVPYPMTRPQYQQPIIPQVPQNTCEIVGDLETVKAAQLDMTGQPKFYPLSDGSAVYRKQLMPDGTSKIFTYTLTTDSKEVQPPETVDSQVIDSLRAINDRLDTLAAQVQAINNLWGGASNE